MIAARIRARRRTLVGLGTAAILFLSACGGGGGSKAANVQSGNTGGVDATTSTTAASPGGSGSCFTKPGTQTARVRFVNLFTNATYPSGDIDVWQGYGGNDACGKKLATVPYGTASDYIDVTASDSSGDWQVGAYPPGATDEAHQIISQSETWKGGEQVTIIVMGQDPNSGNPPSSGGDQAFFEKPLADPNALTNPVTGKGLVIIGAASVQYIAPKDAAWVAGVAGQANCITAVGDTDPNTRTNIGGTSLVPYAVDPGSINLGLYPSVPGSCTGTPDIGPTTIDAAAGSRTLVLVYGTDTKSLKLLVLPVAS